MNADLRRSRQNPNEIFSIDTVLLRFLVSSVFQDFGSCCSYPCLSATIRGKFFLHKFGNVAGSVSSLFISGQICLLRSSDSSFPPCFKGFGFFCSYPRLSATIRGRTCSG